MASKFKSFLYDERKATKHLKVASVTMQCDAEPEINRAKMVERVETIKSAHPDVELILFGETILGWYNPAGAPEYHRNTAESIPGETTEGLADLALEHGVYLSFGISELSDGKLYNAQVLIDPAGKIQAVHHKRRLKEKAYTPGTVPVTVTNIKGVKTGIVICYDAAGLRTMRELIKNRLDLILLSLADDEDEGFFMAKFNARMYNAWIVTANRYGDEENHFWNGHMVVSDPVGRLRAKSQDKEQYLVYELGFVSGQSWPKRLARNVFVKASLILHVLKNWKRAQAYI